MISSNFYVIGKKNYQTSVSDTDREIPTIGSTDNAGNSANLVSRIIRLLSDLGLFCLHQRPKIDSVYLFVLV